MCVCYKLQVTVEGASAVEVHQVQITHAHCVHAYVAGVQALLTGIAPLV